MSRIDGWLRIEGSRISLDVAGALPESQPQSMDFPLRDAETASAALKQLLAQAVPEKYRTMTVSLAGVWLRWESRPWGSSTRQGWTGMSSQAFGAPLVEAQIPAPLMQVLSEYSSSFRFRFCSVPEAAFQLSRTTSHKAAVAMLVLETDCLTCIRYQSGRWLDAVAYPGRVADRVALETAWHRLQLRHPVFSGCEQRELVDTTASWNEEDLPQGFTRIARPVLDASHWRRVQPLLAWPFRRQQWDTRALVMLAASLLLLGVSLGGFAWFGQQKAALAAELAMSDSASRPAAVIGDADKKKVSLEIAKANEVIRYLNTPVDALLLAIAPGKPSEVALLSLQVKAGRSHSLTLEGEASSMNSLANYVEALSRQAVFSSVWLARHEVRSGVDKPYLFSIELEWVQ